jgi:hypothetical protein
MRDYKLYAGLILIVLALVAGGFIYDHYNVQSPTEDKTAAEISTKYDEKLSLILKKYSEEASAVNINDLEPITSEVLRDLLELRVPASEKDAHLALVLVLNKLENSLEEKDAGKVNEAIKEFNNISPVYKLQFDQSVE